MGSSIPFAPGIYIGSLTAKRFNELNREIYDLAVGACCVLNFAEVDSLFPEYLLGNEAKEARRYVSDEDKSKTWVLAYASITDTYSITRYNPTELSK